MGTSFHLHIQTTLHLDTLIKSILLYASDFWGGLKPPKDNPIERFHTMACKQILGVQKQTTNIGVLLELGRIPLQTYAIKAAIKNWERIKLRKANINLLKNYDDALTNNLPWITNIKEILEKNGMACFYTNKKHERTHPFIHKKIFQRLSDTFHQDAFSTITNPESKLRTYGLLKRQKGIEKYLFVIVNPNIRKTLTKFRLSNHTLNIEKGRHQNLKEHQRVCPFCPNTIETEIHFLLDCPSYSTPRQNMIQKTIQQKPSFLFYTPQQKFQYLLAEENTQFVSKFVHNFFEIREFLLLHHRMPT